MKNKSTIVYAFLAVVFIYLSIGSSSAQATDGKVGYSVEPHIPPNQIDKRQSYFDLRMEPGETQELKVTVWNSTEEEAEINVSINNPITNRNGMVDYTVKDAEIDESLEHPITGIASVEEDLIKVPAGGSKDVIISLDMPKEEFDGVVLGGIYFEKAAHDEENKEASVQIKNKYAYVVGLQLAENDKLVKPEFHLKSVEPSVVHYRPAIVANIQNSQPLIAGDMEIAASVFDANGKEIAEFLQTDISMAPNSNMDFVMGWENQALKPGYYSLELVADFEGEKWKWEEEFEIEPEEAREVNEAAINVEKDNTKSIIGGFTFVMAILVLIILRLMRKNKKLARQQ